MNDERFPTLAKIALAVFLIAGAFFLLTEHRAHTFGVLPYVLLLACPLMHLLGHGHGGHGDKTAKSASPERHNHDHGTGA